jgi:hypothetical protein
MKTATSDPLAMAVTLARDRLVGVKALDITPIEANPRAAVGRTARTGGA